MPPLPPFAQSALAPAGREAESLAALFWWLCGAALAVWLLAAALTFLLLRRGAGPRARRALILWGGAAVPVAALAVLLAAALPLLAERPASAPPGALRVEVTGLQWWWRVRYRLPGGEAVETANEVRLPVGEPVEFLLDSADVIHSFWIPPLAGKLDMFPGRRTRLVLTPTRAGRYRGACAEYCGTSHALMAFDVLVQERADFDAWLRGQAAPAAAPSGEAAVHGRRLFASSGCASCHAVRGTGAEGLVGPDLTHVGSRPTLAAGTLPAGAASFSRWLERAHELKPGALMPEYAMLPAGEREALAAYLEALR